MNLNNTVIMVSYRKKPNVCRCCGRDFEGSESEYGAVKQFEFTVQGFFEWIDWDAMERFTEHVPVYGGKLCEDELAQSVEEYVINTISFYRCGSEDILHIEQSEVDKVFAAVKGEVMRLLAK